MTTLVQWEKHLGLFQEKHVPDFGGIDTPIGALPPVADPRSPSIEDKTLGNVRETEHQRRKLKKSTSMAPSATTCLSLGWNRARVIRHDPRRELSGAHDAAIAPSRSYSRLLVPLPTPKFRSLSCRAAIRRLSSSLAPPGDGGPKDYEAANPLTLMGSSRQADALRK